MASAPPLDGPAHKQALELRAHRALREGGRGTRTPLKIQINNEKRPKTTADQLPGEDVAALASVRDRTGEVGRGEGR